MSPVLPPGQAERGPPAPTWHPTAESQHTSSPHPGLRWDLNPEVSHRSLGSIRAPLRHRDGGQAADPQLSEQSWILQLLVAAGLVFLLVIYIFLDLIFICYILELRRA